jgi:predicted ABC-type exoprotein transport system permease subunit
MGKLKSPLKRPHKMKKGNRYIEGVVAVVQQLFVILLITFILLLLVETIWQGRVSSFLNLNCLLIAVIVIGVIAILTRPEKVKKEVTGRPGRTDIIMAVWVGLGGAAIVWYKTKEIGWLSYVISVVSGGLIVLLSMLVWQGDEEAEIKSHRRAVIEAEEVMKRTRREAEDTFKRVKREAKEAKRTAIREAKEAMEKAIRQAK